ncbi:hypothetical protein D3C81_1712470 [compost metagenome]
MEGDVAGAGLDEVADDPIDRLDHQVGVDRRADAVLAQGAADHRADGQVGHVVVVHHVEVDDVGAGGENLVDLLAQAGEIGGEDRRGDGERLHGYLGRGWQAECADCSATGQASQNRRGWLSARDGARAAAPRLPAAGGSAR